MASTIHVVYGALAALAFWGVLGWPLTRRLLDPPLATAFAPLAGWALHSVIAVPLFFALSFSGLHIALVGGLAFMLSIGMAAYDARAGRSARGMHSQTPAQSVSHVGAVEWERIPVAAWIGAAAVALACASAILPKHLGDGVILSDQIFDHAKIAIIDDIARLGLPPGNPFFAHDGGSGHLAYYYLWHFSAAELSRLLQISGWEADAAMTFFSAFTSLAAMMALAVACSRRSGAAVWVVALAAAGSGRVILERCFGVAAIENWVPAPGGLGGWEFQSSWVPQHVASSTCVLLALLLLVRLSRRVGVVPVLALSVAIAAGFESSTWIGGIVFALIACLVVPLLLVRAKGSQRMAFCAALVAGALLTVALIWPFLVAEIAGAGLRASRFPVAVEPFRVLGPALPAGLRGLLDWPAYWLLLLPIELPAMYATGMVVLVGTLLRRPVWRGHLDDLWVLAVSGLVALLCSWLLVSTLADNNDLAWRALLQASSILIVFAAVGIATWVARRRTAFVVIAVVALSVGIPETVRQTALNMVGDPGPGARAFAQMPAMWERVRAHTGDTERIANNPSAFEKMTPWPVNISWSLLAKRRSCYAGWELTQVYSSVPHDKLWPIDVEFKRVFAGTGTSEDVHDLAVVYDCSVAVVTPEDGAWHNDPFRASAFYELVEEDPARWRIYRRRGPMPDP